MTFNVFTFFQHWLPCNYWPQIFSIAWIRYFLCISSLGWISSTIFFIITYKSYILHVVTFTENTVSNIVDIFFFAYFKKYFWLFLLAFKNETNKHVSMGEKCPHNTQKWKSHTNSTQEWKSHTIQLMMLMLHTIF